MMSSSLLFWARQNVPIPVALLLSPPRILRRVGVAILLGLVDAILLFPFVFSCGKRESKTKQKRGQ